MNERLTLELEAKAIGQESIERLTLAMERLAKTSEGVGRIGPRGIAGGLSDVGSAAETASKKVQSFVGAIPGMGVAAERFINLIPGLGKAIVSAFPVLGAIAFAEGLGRVGSALNDAMEESIGFKRAMEELKEATKATTSAIDAAIAIARPRRHRVAPPESPSATIARTAGSSPVRSTAPTVSRIRCQARRCSACAASQCSNSS